MGLVGLVGGFLVGLPMGGSLVGGVDVSVRVGLMGSVVTTSGMT